MRRHWPGTLAIALLFGAGLGAQTSTDLERAIRNHFEVNADVRPTLTPLNGSFADEARALRDELNAIGPARGLVATVNGVAIHWENGSAVCDANGAILLVTGADGEPGADVTAEVRGEQSSVYAVAGNGIGLPRAESRGAQGGNAKAIASPTSNAAAYGGDGQPGAESKDAEGGKAAVAEKPKSRGWVQDTFGCVVQASSPEGMAAGGLGFCGLLAAALFARASRQRRSRQWS